MRYLLILVYFFTLKISLSAQGIEQEAQITPILSFIENEINLGEAMEGEVLNYTFKFINKGNDALVITNILTSCGCTIVDWSREPIYPGKKGEIVARFDTKNKIGLQKKSIIILSNSINDKDEVQIIANIIPRSEAKVK